VAHDVFVSYSKHNKVEADAVCAALEAKGIRCWIAPRDVIPGQEWGAAIVDAIQSSRVMVLIFSNHANNSPQIRREVQLAVDMGTVLIPFRIEDVAPAQSLRYFLGTPHWLDAITPPLEAHLARLAPAVANFLAASEPDGSTAGTAIPPETSSVPHAEPMPVRESAAVTEKPTGEGAFGDDQEPREARPKTPAVTDISSTTEPLDGTKRQSPTWFQRLDSRNKILLALGVLAVVVAVVAGIVSQSKSSPSAASKSTTSGSELSSTTTPTVAPMTRLLALAPSWANCSPDQSISGSGNEIATVACRSGATQVVPDYLTYRLYPDKTTLDKSYNYFIENHTVACPGMALPQTWSNGKVACLNNGYRYVYWTIDDQLVIGGVSGNNIDSLYQWWSAHYQ
jgi:hypothetical protein